MAKTIAKKKPATKAAKKSTSPAKPVGGMKIKNWADVCKYHGIDQKKLPDVSSFPKELHDYMLNMFKACMITSALNEGWIPDWKNTSEYKYRLWFWIKASKDKPSGFGFSDANCGYAISDADVGSRLLFKSSGLAMHAAKKFPDVYKAIILIGK